MTPTLMRALAAHARQQPRAVALLAPARRSLSYEALLRALDRTQNALAAAGFGQGDRIAVALPNGPELAVALLAVTDCATCAPLNPLADEATCAFLLRRMGIAALIVAADADTPVVRAGRELGLPLLRLSYSSTDPAGVFTLTTETARRPVAVGRPSPDTVSLLLHTSGTTAKPKLVPLTSANLTASASGRARLLGLAPADRVLCVAPMYTSSGVKRNLWPTLWAGASVVCAPGFEGDSFLGWLEEFQPTIYVGNPAIHRAVLDALDRHGTPRHSLRFAISTSAPMLPAIHSRIELALGVPLLQAYATTENGAITQMPLPPGERRVGSVGLPAGSDVMIADASGLRCAPREVGEIMVRGPEVFEGYEGDPEATVAAFRDGWFRTGDLGYVDEDGYVFISGRSKDLINRGGFKVSPGEVDSVLLGHPAVFDAATFGVGHPTLGEDVVAAVVLRAPHGVTPQELRDYALERLTTFKVPTRIVVVDAIPRTALGKVRRRELGGLFATALHAPHTAPRGPHEILVAKTFAAVLGLRRVGAHDNFFELGGDSLRGAQVIGRIGAALGREFTPLALFRRPTVAEFAREIATVMSTPHSSVPPPIVPRRRTGTDAKRTIRR